MNILDNGKKVIIVDYGLGNVRSVAKMVRRAQVDYAISSDPNEILNAGRIILPGVGAFGDGICKLKNRGLIEPLNEAVLEKGTPILGICLGMALMASIGEEHGEHEGLGWISGRVKRFDNDSGLRIPHVGWNGIQIVNRNPLFEDIPSAATFYFTHSYVLHNDDPANVTSTCDYGETFTAAVMKNNIFGCQFHPEKSQRNGGVILHHFMLEDL
jgi:imidazole glycerol-phosphate synthase subunit HisH